MNQLLIVNKCHKIFKPFRSACHMMMTVDCRWYYRKQPSHPIFSNKKLQMYVPRFKLTNTFSSLTAKCVVFFSGFSICTTNGVIGCANTTKGMIERALPQRSAACFVCSPTVIIIYFFYFLCAKKKIRRPKRNSMIYTFFFFFLQENEMSVDQTKNLLLFLLIFFTIAKT